VVFVVVIALSVDVVARRGVDDDRDDDNDPTPFAAPMV
jgi:hypothetical protein